MWKIYFLSNFNSTISRIAEGFQPSPLSPLMQAVWLSIIIIIIIIIII